MVCLLEINRENIKIFNEIGFRDCFGNAILDIGENCPEVVVMAADLSDACRVTEFSKRFPDRFFQVGIAEQNMVGIAAGLALGGQIAFATTFATFASLRSCEQVRTDTAYPRLNVKMLGIDSGVAVGTLGPTHYAIEDIGVFRCMPNMVVLCPADGLEVIKAAWAAVKHDGPVYIRLSGGKGLKAVYEEDYDFEIGKAVTLKEGMDVTIFATGLMVSRAVHAARSLEEKGVSARVVNMHTLKPIDADVIRKAAKETRLLVTVEEHNIIGGLGSAVAEVLSETGGAPRLVRMGIQDEFPHIGSHDEILARCGLTDTGIVEKVLKNLL
jgi:transketolase